MYWGETDNNWGENPKDNKCKCGHNEKANYDHPCPYQADMNGDSSDHCDCCNECEHQCAMDI